MQSVPLNNSCHFTKQRRRKRKKRRSRNTRTFWDFALRRGTALINADMNDTLVEKCRAGVTGRNKSDRAAEDMSLRSCWLHHHVRENSTSDKNHANQLALHSLCSGRRSRNSFTHPPRL